MKEELGLNPLIILPVCFLQHSQRMTPKDHSFIRQWKEDGNLYAVKDTSVDDCKTI